MNGPHYRAPWVFFAHTHLAKQHLAPERGHSQMVFSCPRSLPTPSRNIHTYLPENHSVLSGVWDLVTIWGSFPSPQLLQHSVSVEQGATLWCPFSRTNSSKKVEGVLRGEGQSGGWKRNLHEKKGSNSSGKSSSQGFLVYWLVSVKVTQEAAVIWEEGTSKCLHQLVLITKVTMTVATMVDEQSRHYNWPLKWPLWLTT